MSSYNQVVSVDSSFVVCANYSFYTVEQILAKPELVYGTFSSLADAVEFCSKQDKIDELLSTYSDMYKEVYNFRPRGFAVDNTSQDGMISTLENLIANLIPAMNAQAIEQMEVQAENIVEFESLVKTIMKYCSCDRATGLRHLFDAEGLTNDSSRDKARAFDLPYDYFEKTI